MSEKDKMLAGELYAKLIKIENNVWIGWNVVVLLRVTIRDIVGIVAGSVVNKDIKSNSVEVGNFCRIKGIKMRKLNLIVVFNTNLDKVLFCIRAKEPYKGMYNFVGGKVEQNESNDEAAYRELFEETGISDKDIELDHFMDLNYFKYENNLQVYYGILKHEVNLIEEKNKLEWVNISEDLLDNSKFAGNYNIPHIIRQIKVYLKNGIGIDKY